MDSRSAALRFPAQAREILSDLLDEPGVILNSRTDTLRPGALFVMGHNPGTGQKNPKRKTIRQHLAEFRTRGSAFDKPWSRNDLIPNRLRWLLSELGANLAEVCVSNLIFTHSSTARGSGYPERAHACWPVHELILRIVRPRLLLAIGCAKLSPFAYLREKFGPTREIEPFPSGHANWNCKAFCTRIDGRPTWIAGIPHISRYKIQANPGVAGWLRELGWRQRQPDGP